MNEQTNQCEDAKAAGRYRPSLAFYHPNAKGTGCALKLSLHPAHDDRDGCIMMTLANQLTLGDRRAANPVFPTFDWEGRLTVKLDFSDLTQIVQVFRGERESLADGKGLYHTTSKFSTRIALRHLVEPTPCYPFEVYRSARSGSAVGDAGAADTSARIVLSESEALGLCLAIETSFGVVCFGIPMLVEHDTSAYRREQREFRRAPAA